MSWQYTPYTLPLFLAAIVSMALALLGWRRRAAPGATWFVVLMVAVAEWALAYALRIGCTNVPCKILWVKVEYLGIAVVPVAWLALTLQYTGRAKWLTRRNVALLSIVPLITLLLVWTNDVHHLMGSDITLNTAGPFAMLEATWGPGFWLHAAYTYLILLTGTVLLLQALLRPSYVYRGQAATLLVAALVPWIGNALYLAGVGPFWNLDFSPFALTITGLAMAWAIYRYQLLDLVPVAYDTVIENLSDGVIVLDAQNRIVDLNPVAQSFTSIPADEAIGQSAFDVYSEWAEWVERYGHAEQLHREISFREDGDLYCCDLRIAPLYNQHGGLSGRLVTFRDVSERKRMEEALRESETRFRAIFENAAIGVTLTDTEGRPVVSNPALQDIFGYSNAELREMSFTEFTHPDDARADVELFRELMAGQRDQYQMEKRYRRKDGELIWGRLTASLIRDAEGYPQFAIGMVEDVTERKRTEELLQRQAEEIAAFHATSFDLITSQNLPELLHTIVERAAHLLGTLSGSLYLCDPERREVRCVVGYNTPQDRTDTILEYGEGAAGTVTETGEPLIINDYRTWPGRATQFEAEQPHTSLLSVPMLWQGEVLGVIHVHHNEKGQQFDVADLETLTLFANQAAIAVKNAQLFEEIQRHSDRLAQTLALSASLHRGLEPQQVLQQIVEGVLDLGFRRAVINVYEPDEVVRPQAVAGLDETEREKLLSASYRWSDFEALMQERFRISGSYLICQETVNWQEDFQGLILVPNGEDRGRGYWHPEDMLLVPLWGAGGEPVGLLSVDEPENNLRPDLHTIQTLESFANQAAVAVQNTQLLENEREHRELAEAHAAELREREHYLTQLNNLTHVALETPDFQDLLQTLAERLGNLIEADGCYLTLWDPKEEQAIPAAANAPLRETYPTIEAEPDEVTMTASVLRAGHALVAEDVFNSPYVSPRIASHFPARSLLGLPLIADGQKLGAALIAFNEPHHFTADEIARGEQAAAQIALALAKVRALEAAQRRKQEAETLREAGAVVTSALRQDEAIERILEQLERVVPYDSASVQLLREGYLEIVGGRGWTDLSAVVGLQFSIPGDNPNTVVVQECRPHILGDAPRRYPPFQQGPHNHIRSWLGVPLIVHDRVIGMLAVDSTQPDKFTPHDAQLTAAFADQVAIALENARLFDSEHKRRRELEALRQASLQLTSSLELEPVLEAILDQALQLSRADDAHIFLYDGERLTFGAAMWEDGRQETPYAEPRPGGFTHTVAQTGERIVIPDVDTHPLFQDWQWGGAIVGLPLRVSDQVRGVMNVAFHQPHAFEEDELRVLELLADQAALAIRNAQLHAEVQKLATTDSLTGLHNRRGLFEVGRQEVERARRFNRPLAAVMIDIDRFKPVNDRYGHPVGDKVLIWLARHWQQALREVDTLGRYGGEEFVALLPETDLAAAQQVAERLRRDMENADIEIREGTVNLTLSAGVATLTDAGDNLETLVERADEALYAAKQAGRNRVAVWENQE